MPDRETTIALVQEHYGKIARGEQCGCGAPTAEFAKIIGYAEKDVTSSKGNLGLGCGNPLALAEIEPGMTVLDLGSGAGFDAFIAWRHVGPTGRVIGVDMTDDMLAQARKNAADLGAGNVEFRQGYIEALPVEDASVDLVISNCVINLSADKPAVFREIFRVLKPGGRFAVSDLVLLGKLPAEVEADVRAYVGCIAGASPIADYIRFALDAGLNALSIPEIATGRALMESMTPGSSCCSDPVVDAAAAAIASVKLHGSKSAN